MARTNLPILSLSCLVVGLTSCAEAELPTDTFDPPVMEAVLGQPTVQSTTGVPMVDLGVLPGEPPDALSVGYGINSASKVVGASGGSAFLWRKARGFQKLEIGWAEALDVNDPRQVTGDRDFGCRDLAMGFVWDDGRWQDLGSLLGSDPDECQAGSTGRAINNSGQIVGWSDPVPFDPFGPWTQRGFLWEDGAMTDLGSLAVWSEAWGINEGGWIVGYTDTPFEGPKACIWEPGSTQPQLLGFDSYGWSIALDVNSLGTVVGWTNTAGDVEHAYRWQDGVMEDLGALGPDYPWSKARAVNENGVAVGVSVPDPFADFEGRATLWVPGDVPVDLGALPGGANSSAFAVNNRGIVVGWSDTDAGEFHVVMWIP